MSLSPGARLGPYEILSPLGAGGMGEVYRARDPRLGRDVAIKVLPASFSSNPDRLKRFEQEARAAGVLNHPNITIVYDIGRQDEAPYVVQELLEGETLRADLTGGRRLAPRKAVDYSIQIAQGLAAAHEKGIVHRDLKPENLFVTKEGRVKILDFGLAKLTQAEGPVSASNLPTATEPGVIMGTLGYMSPEQIKGEAVDGRSDIFTLGAILYEMLSGQRAFRGDSAAETMAAILKEDPPDLLLANQNANPGLERLVHHCLEKSPERRFQSARDLAYDLETLSTASGATVPAGMRVGRSSKWRAPLAAAALVAAGLLAGWGVGKIRQKPASPAYTRMTFRRGTVFTARFAPDGQTVVYSAAWEGQPARIFAARVGSLESRQLPLPDSRVLAVSPTGELAIQLGRETVWESTGTLARVPLEGGAPRELLENVTLADWSPDGRDLAVVHKVGGRYRVEFPIGKVLYETADGIESMRLSPRGDRLAISPYIGDLLCIDLTGKVTTVTRGWRYIGNIAWRSDDEIWFGGHKGSEKYAVYAVTLSAGERLVREEAGGIYFHDVSRNGRVLLNDYFWNSSLVALTGATGAERDLPWMDRSAVADIGHDGRSVLFTEWGEGGGGKKTVYLRAVDATAAVRLGEGWGLALSPDGRWVLTRPAEASDPYLLLPTGPGQPKRLEHKGLTTVDSERFLPDGTGFLFLARAGKGPLKAYVQSLDGGEPREVSREGLSVGSYAELSVGGVAVSPDGRFFAALGPDALIAIYSMNGGGSKPLAGVENGEIPILWSADGRSIYAYKVKVAPAPVFKLDVATGRRELWKTVAPADRSGLVAIDGIVMTPDATSYAYCYERILTSLQVVDGLR
jgi:hypothetical protein